MYKNKILLEWNASTVSERSSQKMMQAKRLHMGMFTIWSVFEATNCVNIVRASF